MENLSDDDTALVVRPQALPALAPSPLDSDQALAGIGRALRVIEVGKDYPTVSIRHEPGEVARATVHRDQVFELIGPVCDARHTLSDALRRNDPPDHQDAAALIGSLLAAVGVRADRRMLNGMLAVLDPGSDDLGSGLGLWEPVHVTTPVLALAVQKILVSSKFPPRPSELHAALREVRHKLRIAKLRADSFLDSVQRADAVLLAFARDEWKQPYLIPENRTALAGMLRLHLDWGGSLARDHPFKALIARETDNYLGIAPALPAKRKEDRS